MKKHRGLLAAALALVSVSAEAADVYTGGLKDAPVYVPVNTWTGFYFGANGGYGGSASNRTLSTSTDYLYYDGNVSPGTFPLAIGKLAPEGGFAGGQFGYNLQRGNIVFGFEIDAQASDIKGKVNASANTGDLVDPQITINAGAKSELDWFGTLRARLGYAAGPALVYVTGGFAVGAVKNSLSVNSSPDYGSFSFSNNETRTGYVIGGGLEYLISPAWSLKAEYQYIDLGSSSIKGTIFSTDLETYAFLGALSTSRIDHTYNTARIGLNYHINQVFEPLK